jgi:acyl-coenzyme A thioesterase PaaI-like protein
VTYLEPAVLGEVTATALVRKRGKRITVVEAEVSQGDDVVALALGTFTSG